MCPSVLGRMKWAKMNLRGPKVVPNGPSTSKSYPRKGGKNLNLHQDCQRSIRNEIIPQLESSR